jgi:hypothetical protein
LIENAHAVAAACVTVKICPPIVSLPVRATVVVLAPTLKLTLPTPVPEVGLVNDSHETLLAADQVQLEVVVTVTVPLPPAAATV